MEKAAPIFSRNKLSIKNVETVRILWLMLTDPDPDARFFRLLWKHAAPLKPFISSMELPDQPGWDSVDKLSL